MIHRSIGNFFGRPKDKKPQKLNLPKAFRAYQYSNVARAGIAPLGQVIKPKPASYIGDKKLPEDRVVKNNKIAPIRPELDKRIKKPYRAVEPTK